MHFNNIKPFIPVDDIIIPPNGVDNKFISITVLGENTDFFNTVNKMNLGKTRIKYVFLPSTKAPMRTFMDMTYRKNVIDMKLKPIKKEFDEISGFDKNNFYLDSTFYLNKALNKWKIDKFNTKRAVWVVNNFFDNINKLSGDKFQKVLIYSVDTSTVKQTNLMYKKILPIYLKLLKEGKCQFDKIILFTYNSTEKSFTLLYDKDKKINLARIRKILISLKPDREHLESNKFADGEDIPDDIFIDENDIKDIDNFASKLKENVSIIINKVKNIK